MTFIEFDNAIVNTKYIVEIEKVRKSVSLRSEGEYIYGLRLVTTTAPVIYEWVGSEDSRDARYNELFGKLNES